VDVFTGALGDYSPLPYIKTEALSELRVLCQEILTKKLAVGQETLTKTLLQQKNPDIKQE
jgi:hypothetical protein